MGDRVPASDLSAERSVLGGVLIDNAALERAMEVMGAEDMSSPAHGLILDAMVRLAADGQPIDELTVAESLRAGMALDKVGGVAFLATLARTTPTSAHVAAYARIVHDRALRRRTAAVATGIVEECGRDAGDVHELVDRAQQMIMDLTNTRRGRSEHLKGILVQSFKALESAHSAGSAITGVPTGYGELDVMLAGLQRAELIVVAGASSMGKTSFALNVAANAALRHHVPTLIFSLEMSRHQLANRLMGSEARVGLGRIRTGSLAAPDWINLSLAAGKLAEAALWIDDSGVMTVQGIRTECRRRKRENSLGLVVVDYLQLLDGPVGGDGTNRAQEVAAVSRALKKLSIELDVPVVALSQLSRGVEKRTDKRPMMSDLRESGAIEQDADVVIFLYRDEYYNKDSPERGTAEVIIAKQRNGPTGTVKLAFLPHLTRFENIADDGSPSQASQPTSPDARTEGRGAA